MQMNDGDVEVEMSNILLLGPSGTGKTLLASTLVRIVDLEGVRLEFTPEARAAIAREAIKRGTGARACVA